jgi:O-antigen/teichoic acid export membrane protein
VASTPAGAVEFVELAILAAVEPFVFGLEPHEVASAVERLVRRLGLLLLATAAVLAFAAPELARILAPSSYGPVAAAIPCLLFAAAGRSTARLVTLGAGIARRTSFWTLSAGAYLVLSLAGVALVVPAWGSFGAAAANLVASVATLLVSYALVLRVWPVPLPAPMLAILGAAGSAVSTMLASDAFGLLAPLWLRAVAGLLLVGLSAVALLGPVRPRSRVTPGDR